MLITTRARGYIVEQGQATASVTDPEPSIGQDKKYCMDCGKVILRRAEICPACGCRQLPAHKSQQSGSRQTVFASEPTSPELQSHFVGQMAALLLLNCLWNGLGNLAIGDKRGWVWGFFNWVVLAIGFFTFWIPCLLFFAYCGYAGYQFLCEKTRTVQS